jgi:hypothetical protein
MEGSFSADPDRSIPDDHPWPAKMAKSSACSLKLNLQRSEAIFAMRTWAFLWRIMAMIVASTRMRNRERLAAT